MRNKRKWSILFSCVSLALVVGCVCTGVWASSIINTKTTSSITLKVSALSADVYLDVADGDGGQDNPNLIKSVSITDKDSNECSAIESGDFKNSYLIASFYAYNLSTNAQSNVSLQFADGDGDGYINLGDTFVYTLSIVNKSPQGGTTIYGNITLGTDTAMVSASLSSTENLKTSTFTIAPNQDVETITIYFTIIASSADNTVGYSQVFTNQLQPTISIAMSTSEPEED